MPPTLSRCRLPLRSGCAHRVGQFTGTGLGSAPAAVAQCEWRFGGHAGRGRRLFALRPGDRGFCAVPNQESFPSAGAGAAAASDPRKFRPMTETIRTFLNPAHFFALLRSHGTEFFAGVPDSLLKDICAFISSNVSADRHVIAANEGTALATAAGHYLATGKIPCVYMQNSGLGNAVNPLLSLCSGEVYSIPVLLIVGWRGEPGKKDEPQHLLQGRLTPQMLKQMQIPFEILPDYAEGAFGALNTAYKYMNEHQAPFALLVKKQTFEKYNLDEQDVFTDPNMYHREEVLEHVLSVFPEEPLVTTTGFTSRELFELRVNSKQGHETDFLTVGSMGHCSSIALGVAAANPGTQVACIDGDGAAIMHMGALVTAGKMALENFKHILINNAVHDSVGGQPTGAHKVDFPAIAAACGYRGVERVSAASEVPAALRRLREGCGPRFLEVQVLPGARSDLGRPTTTTHQCKEAFMAGLAALQPSAGRTGRA